MLLFAISLLCIGGLVALLSGIWTLALAFQRHLLWGLTVLVVPLGNVAFVCARWREARTPFLLGVGSLLLMGSALYSMPQNSLRRPFQTAISTIRQDQLQQQQTASQHMMTARREAQGQLRLIRLKKQESALLARQADLSSDDFAAKQSLSGEIERYDEELREALPPELRHVLVSR